MPRRKELVSPQHSGRGYCGWSPGRSRAPSAGSAPLNRSVVLIMGKPTDIRVVGTRLYFLPIRMRMPLKFGPETVTAVTCARACVRVADSRGRTAEGWGETPLSVQWVWASQLPYELRLETLKRFCVMLAEAWTGFEVFGHPIEVGQDFQEQVLPGLLSKMNEKSPGSTPGPDVIDSASP